jgi:hydroxymethylglutaryl-CoA lyase
MASSVTVVEVSPRDGLQNEESILSTEDKIELIERCVAAGVRRIEAVSFVHPGRVPQMADAEAVMAGVERRDGVRHAGLILNDRGFERALTAGMDEVNYVVVATDTFGTRNQGTTTDEALGVWEKLAPRAKDAKLFTTVTIGATFGCPFEGEVSVERIAQIVTRLAATGVDEIALADTIGVAAPDDVLRKLETLAELAPEVQRRCHLHNTRNTGLANAYAAVEAGVHALDASLGGIGGCPFAPNATGNIPTEDVAYLLHRMGVATGLDLPALLPSVPWLAERLGKPVPGLLSKAGLFPAEAA